jgi:hypothetical protein
VSDRFWIGSAAAIAAAAVIVGHVLPASGSAPTSEGLPASAQHPATTGTDAIAAAVVWRARYLAEVEHVRSLEWTLRHDGNVVEALNLACTVYGNCATLWRRARCETGGTFRAAAANSGSSARGLLQFLTRGRARRYGDGVLVDGGTWATTPFWRFNVYSPYANALAAGWMLTRGRGGEWSCK